MKTQFLRVAFLLFTLLPSLLYAQGWQWAISNNGSSGNNYIYSMATDPGGNVLMAGHLTNRTTTFGSYTIYDTDGNWNWQIFVAKVSPAGNFLWALGSNNTSSSAESSPIKITTDLEGNSYLLGTYGTYNNDSTWVLGNVTVTNHDYKNNDCYYFLAKFDPSGNILWVQNIAPSAYNSISDFDDGDLVVDKGGHIYVSCQFTAPVITIASTTLTNKSGSYFPGLLGNDIFLAMYDTNGNAIWAKSFGGSNDEGFPKLTASANGIVYLAGWYLSDSITFGNYKLTADTSYHRTNVCFLAKLDSAGDVLWAENSYSNGSFRAIAADDSGNVYITGNFAGDSLIFGQDTVAIYDYNSFLLVKYSSSGNIDWVHTVNGNETIGYAGMGVTIDPCGNILASVSLDISYDSTNTLHLINFEGNVITVPAASNSATFVTGCDPAGNNIPGMFVPVGNTPVFAYYNGVVTDNNGSFYTAGSFSRPELTLGSTTLFYNDTIQINDTTIYVDSTDGKLFLAKYTYISPLSESTSAKIAGICAGSTTVLEGPSGYLTYEWSDSTSGIDKTINKAGYWTVYCTNICAGKAETEFFTVGDEDCNSCITMPNAFTPNDDGRGNDFFRAVIEPWCNINLYSLHVYDRWGKEIFFTNDPAAGWDGKYKGQPQDMGIYMYLLEYRNPVGYTMHTLKGAITLIR